MTAALVLLITVTEHANSLPDWIPVAALVAAAVSLISLGFNRLWDRRDRRRTLYSNAYQAALSWEEMFYRVRRRDPDKLYVVAKRFHAIQEQIDFHQGWIASESAALGRAYCRLILTIKAHALEPIRAAWLQPPVSPDDGFSVDPIGGRQIDEAKERFIADLRDHLSFWPQRRLALRKRYRDAKWEQINEEIKQSVE